RSFFAATRLPTARDKAARQRGPNGLVFPWTFQTWALFGRIDPRSESPGAKPGLTDGGGKLAACRGDQPGVDRAVDRVRHKPRGAVAEDEVGAAAMAAADE